MIQKIGTLGQAGGPLLMDRILTNSIVVAIGDSVKTTAGFLALGTAGARVFGHVEGIFSTDGFSPVKDGTFRNNIGEAYTVASNNQTVGMVSARVDIDQNSLYSAEVSAALGTTAGSGLAGKTFDLTDEDTLNEASVLETTAQYYSHGPDRNLTTQLMVNILESEVFGF